MKNIRAGATLRIGRRVKGLSIEWATTGPVQVIHHRSLNESPDVIFIFNNTAGLFGGDEQHVELDVGEGAAVVITDPTPTQLFPGSGVGTSEVRVQVGDDALCLLLPHALIPAANSHTQANTVINASCRARVLAAGIVAPGRSACGENWGDAEVESRLCLCRSGAPLLLDVSRASSATESRPGHLLSLAAVGVNLSAEQIKTLRAHLAPLGKVGVTTPEASLVVVRGLHRSLEVAAGALRIATNFWLSAQGYPPLDWRRAAYF